jgi:hypothetical protein
MRRFVQKSVDRLEAEVALALAATGGLPPIVPGFSGLPVVNVKAPPFNAVGDGVTDDTNAIQSAFNFALHVIQTTASPIINLFAGPIVFFPPGTYLVSGPAGADIACVECADGITLMGSGAFLKEATGTKHILRWGNYFNAAIGLGFFGGKAAIAMNGPSRIYGGSLGSVTAAAKNEISRCTFRFNHGPSIWLDTSLEPRASTAIMSIEDCDVATSCFFYAGFDGCAIANMYGVVSQDVGSDPNAVPVLDDAGHILPFIVNYGVLSLENMSGVPQASGAFVPASAWIGGSGNIRSRANRFGGESGLLLWRKKTSGISLYGQTLVDIIDPTVNIGGFTSDADGISSTSGLNLMEIFDSFPGLIDFRNPVQGLPTGAPLPGSRFELTASNGIYIDSATCPKATYSNVDKRNTIINLDPIDLYGMLKFRSGTNPLSQVGEDVSAELRRFFNKPSVGAFPSASPTLGVAQNFFPAGKLQLTDADNSSSANVISGAPETSTGYSITPLVATASPASFSVGFNNVTTGLPVGEYTLSFGVKANFNGTIVVSLTNPVSTATPRELAELPFSDGELWQRVEVTFYNDGTSNGVRLDCANVPFGTTPAVGDVSVAFFALHKSRAAKDFTFPGNPNAQNYIPTSYSGAASPAVGTYKVGDVVWNKLPVTGGPIGFVCIVAGSPGTWAPFGTIGFDPSQLAGYAFDYDAGDLILTPGPIVDWPSKVGGPAFTLAGTATAHANGGPNNLPFVSADGIADVMRAATGGHIAAEWFIVASYAVGGTGTIMDGGGGNQGRLYRPLATPAVDFTQAGTLVGASAALEQFAIWDVICDGVNVTVNINEVAAIGPAANVSSGLFGGVTLFNFGGGAGDASATNIARAFGYNAVLSPTNRGKVIAYLQSLYALP